MIVLRINLTNVCWHTGVIVLGKEVTGMIFTRPGKCWHGIPSHTIPHRALTQLPVKIVVIFHRTLTISQQMLVVVVVNSNSSLL